MLVCVGDQFAVAVFRLSIKIAFEGEELPEASSLQPEKVYCETVSGLIVAWAVVPASYHPVPPVLP